MRDRTYQKFVKRWEEVTDIPPQTLGPFTNIYKTLTHQLKVMPWPWYVVAGMIVALVLYLFFGTSVASLVTLLQKSF